MNEPLPIVLRRPEPRDLDPLFAQKNDPEVKRLLGGFGHPMARRDLEEWLEAHRKRTDEVLLAIAAEEDGRCLGHVGLYKIDPVSRSAEFGIMVGDKAAWGRRVGRAATVEMLRHGFRRMNLHRISLTVLATNERAIRLYRSLGFAQEGTLREAVFREGTYVDLLAMALLESEFVDG